MPYFAADSIMYTSVHPNMSSYISHEACASLITSETVHAQPRLICLVSGSLIMWNQRGHHSSAGRRNRKGQFPAGRPLLPPLPEGHASATCPSSLSGGVRFWVLASSIWGTPVSLTSRVTFSPRQVSRSVTSGRWPSVKMWSCLCPFTLLMVLSKEHHFGVKQDLMGGDRGRADGPGMAVFNEVALTQWEASY